MLSACPRCEYPLTGLPADHSCPECGLRYDAASRVYRPTVGVTPFQGFVGFWVALWLMDKLFTVLNAVPPGFRFPLAMTFLLVPVLLGWRYFGRGKKRKLVAILPDLLLIRTTARGREIPWTSISRVSANRGNMAVSAFIRDKKTIEAIGGIFRSKAESREFANRAMRRILGGSPEDTAIQEGVSPEASQSSDPQAVVIDLRTIRESIMQWYTVPAIAAALAVSLTAPVGRTVRIVLAVVVIVASIGAAIVTFVRAPRVSQRITISRFGVTLIRGTDEVLKLPWIEVRSAKLSRFLGTFTIHGDGGQFLFVCHYRELGKFKTVLFVASEIMRLRDVYGRAT